MEVYSDFDADICKFAVEAGFNSVISNCFEYQAGLAIKAI